MKPSITTAPLTKPTDTDADGNSTHGIMDFLSSAFRSQTTLSDKEQRKRALRKRSSGSLSVYHPLQDAVSTTMDRRRDSSGINFALALQEKQDEEEPLFTVKRDEPSSLQQQQLSPPPPPQSPKAPTHRPGRIAKRLSATMNTIMNPIHSNPHGNTSNTHTKAVKDIKPIESLQLVDLLDQHQQASPLHPVTAPLLIDMRPLDQYEKSHIQYSINLNVPSLLIKRYRRGVVSNFNLESFITTPEGTEQFRCWMKQYGITNEQVLSIQKLPEDARIILYDDNMIDKETAVWTLMGVIVKNTKAIVNWLQEGYHGFEKLDNHYIIRPQGLDTPPLPIPSNSTEFNKHFSLFNPPNKLKMPTPMVSRSATTLSSRSNNALAHSNGSNNNNNNVQRRASLFSLDTSMRSKNRSSLTCVAQQQQHQQRRPMIIPTNTDLNSIHESKLNTPIFSPSEEDEIFHTPLERMPLSSASTAASSTNEEELLTATNNMTPKTENEYDFIISEIIPHFLYLGPEIATTDQLDGLQQRSIRRILNMAEECEDDVPGLKETFVYQKIAAQDIVEMQNVQGTLKKAVQAIGNKHMLASTQTYILIYLLLDDSKKHHEPIYVHCKAGKSRSAAAILAYLVLSEHWTLKKAYRHIVKMRPNISPNIGFVAELMKLEEGVHGQVSNFAGTDWHRIDSTHPPSPDTQKEMGRLEKAWKRGSSMSQINSSSSSLHQSFSNSSSSNEQENNKL
jgi:rhodanese-related sulfurtransferase